MVLDYPVHTKSDFARQPSSFFPPRHEHRVHYNPVASLNMPAANAAKSRKMKRTGESPFSHHCPVTKRVYQFQIQFLSSFRVHCSRCPARYAMRSWSCEVICSPILKHRLDSVFVCPNHLQIQPLCGGPSPKSTSEHARILVRLSSNPPRMAVSRRKDEPDYYSIDSDMFDEHVRLCEAHPHLEVIVLSNSLRITQGCRGLLVAGAAIQLILRGKRVSFDVDATFTSDIDNVARAMTTRGGFGSFEQGFRYPDNLKYFPQDSYNEAELRYSQTEKKRGFENWLAQIREWYAYGI
jgi:hypothetical protein